MVLGTTNNYEVASIVIVGLREIKLSSMENIAM
jgi:hypothetical protein